MTIYAAVHIYECLDTPVSAIVPVVDVVPRRHEEPLFVIEYEGQRYLRSEGRLEFFPAHKPASTLERIA